MDQVICNWSTYTGTQCRRNIDHENNDDVIIPLCSIHKLMMTKYQLVFQSVQDCELCDTSEEFKVEPRSYRHLRTIMNSLHNEDDKVEVYMPGGSTEEADISNPDYITLLADNTRYYYSKIKNTRRAETLKILLMKYCNNPAVVDIDGKKYCEHCYRTSCPKNSPKLSVLKKILNGLGPVNSGTGNV